MREVGLPTSADDANLASFHAALATILELPSAEVPDVPLESDPSTGWAVSRWLGGLGLGLVPISEPSSFAWAGPWLAHIRPPGAAGRFVVMYGVPSGVVWDPAGDGVVENDWIDAGFVVAAADIALARPARPEPPTSAGVIEEIWVAHAAGEPLVRRDSARARG